MLSHVQACQPIRDPGTALTSHISPWSGRRRRACVCLCDLYYRGICDRPYVACLITGDRSSSCSAASALVAALLSKRAFRRNIVILGAGRCRGGGIVRVHLCLSSGETPTVRLRPPPALLEITGFFLCVTLSPCLKHTVSESHG